jgi:hypothetical protein
MKKTKPQCMSLWDATDGIDKALDLLMVARDDVDNLIPTNIQRNLDGIIRQVKPLKTNVDCAALAAEKQIDIEELRQYLRQQSIAEAQEPDLA